MKVLVLGCNGMAGHLISLFFQEKGYDVVGFARKPSKLLNSFIIGDALDFKLIEKIISEGCFDVVINCIGLLNQNAENSKADAVLLNGFFPHFLADITKTTTTRIIHMSTDCVFAGNTGPYYEDSVPDGLSFYDRSKAIGEIRNDKDLTFRNSIIGPDINKSGIGLFNWFMAQQKTMHGFTGAVWTGVTTLTLAQAMEAAVCENLTGLYNLVNNDSITKYELCSLFNQYFKSGTIMIEPDNALQLDKSLKNTRTDFAFEVPTYETQIKNMRDWIIDHSSLYPHYVLM